MAGLKSEVMSRLPNLSEIRRRLTRRLPDLTERYAVESLGVFGSYVRGTQRPDSDLDLLVSFRRPIDFFKLVALENELSDFLGISVDLVPEKALKPRIGQRIRAEVVPV